VGKVDKVDKVDAFSQRATHGLADRRPQKVDSGRHESIFAFVLFLFQLVKRERDIF